MRICFPFIGDSLGGSHISSATLIGFLEKYNYNVDVVFHVDGVVASEFRKHNITYKVLNLSSEIGRRKGLARFLIDSFKTFFKIWMYLGRIKPDIVHTNDMRVNLFWTFPAWCCGIPVVWHQRTLFPESRVAGLMGGLSARRIAISEAVKKSLPKKLQPATSLIPNPILLTSPSKQETEEARGLICRAIPAIDSREISFVGFFGALRILKRPNVFVDVIAELVSRENLKVVGLMFGRDMEGLSNDIRSRAMKAGIQDNLFLFGFQRPIEAYMTVCDVIVATAVGEASGRVLIEGFALRRPVVAVKSGGHSEVILPEHNGLLARPDDVSDIARQVKRVLLDQLLRDRLIAGGLKSVEELYSPDSHMNAVTDLYRRSFRQ